jgi:hypothetical protein
MTEDILGSRMRSNALYGQNGSDQKSSIRAGETIKHSAIAQSIVVNNPVSADVGEWQTRKLSDDKVPVHPASRSRNGEGGKVPPSTHYKT